MSSVGSKENEACAGCGLGLRGNAIKKSVPLTRAARILNTIFISAISYLASPNTLLHLLKSNIY